jgi:hypothetical protein
LTQRHAHACSDGLLTAPAQLARPFYVALAELDYHAPAVDRWAPAAALGLR